MSLKKSYINFCEKQVDLPLFAQPFWWDAMTKSWDVVQLKIGQNDYYLPYSIEQKATVRMIRNPHLTPYCGPYPMNPQVTNVDINENEFLEIINSTLPKHDVLNIDFSPFINFTNLLASKRLIKKHTNILELTSRDGVYNQLKPSLKRQIKKHPLLSIYEADDIGTFYNLHTKTFEKLNSKPNIPITAFESAWLTCKLHACGRLFFIKDEEENIHAALFMVYDQTTSYYLAGGTDSSFYGSGAMSKLMWHAIEQSILSGKHYFDFEGSMIPSIDRFFKNYNPTEINYLNASKEESLIFKIYKKLK